MITLSFFERNERRGWLSFGVVAEREWERWVLKLTIREVRSEEGMYIKGVSLLHSSFIT